MKTLKSSVSILFIVGILCQNSVQPTLALKSSFPMPQSMSVRFDEEAIVEANLSYIQSLDPNASSWLYSRLTGRVGRTARPNVRKKEIETKMELGLIERGVPDEYAAILAYSFVRLQPGSLGRLAVWKVLEPPDLEAFESDELDDKSYNHIEIGLAEVANGYKQSDLTPVQTMRALSRIIPCTVFKDIQSATGIGSATLAEAIERHADFDVWVPEAHRIVLEIAPEVTGTAAAWKIVIQQGISRAKAWVQETQQTVRLLKNILRGLNNAWKFVIAVGREKAVPTAIQFVLRDLVEEFGSINAVASRGDLTFRLANQGVQNPDRLTSRGQRKLLIALEALVKDRISDAKFQRALERALGASGSLSALARRSVVSAPTVNAIVSGKASAKSRYRLWPAIRRTRTWQMEELVRFRNILDEMSHESHAEIARRTGVALVVIARVLTWEPREGMLQLYKSSRRAIHRFLEYHAQSTKSLGGVSQGKDYPDFALPEERLRRFVVQNPLPALMDWSNFKTWYLANADQLAGALWEGRHPGIPRPQDYTLSPSGVGAILYKAHFISKQLYGTVNLNGPHFYYALTHSTALMLQIRQALSRLNPRDIKTDNLIKLRDALRPMMDPVSLIRTRDENTLRDIKALQQAHLQGLGILEASKSTGIGLGRTEGLWPFVVRTQHFTPKTYGESPNEFRTLMTEALTLPSVQGIVQEWASQPASAWQIGWLRDATEWVMWKRYLWQARRDPQLKATAQVRAKDWTHQNIERVEENVFRVWTYRAGIIAQWGTFAYGVWKWSQGLPFEPDFIGTILFLGITMGGVILLPIMMFISKHFQAIVFAAAHIDEKTKNKENKRNYKLEIEAFYHRYRAGVYLQTLWQKGQGADAIRLHELNNLIVLDPELRYWLMGDDKQLVDEFEEWMGTHIGQFYWQDKKEDTAPARADVHDEAAQLIEHLVPLFSDLQIQLHQAKLNDREDLLKVISKVSDSLANLRNILHFGPVDLKGDIVNKYHVRAAVQRIISESLKNVERPRPRRQVSDLELISYITALSDCLGKAIGLLSFAISPLLRVKTNDRIPVLRQDGETLEIDLNRLKINSTDANKRIVRQRGPEPIVPLAIRRHSQPKQNVPLYEPYVNLRRRALAPEQRTFFNHLTKVLLNAFARQAHFPRDSARLIANALVRSSPGQIDRLSDWKILENPSLIQNLKSKRKLDRDQIVHLRTSFIQFIKDYLDQPKSNSVTRAQFRELLTRLIPYHIFLQIAKLEQGMTQGTLVRSLIPLLQKHTASLQARLTVAA